MVHGKPLKERGPPPIVMFAFALVAAVASPVVRGGWLPANLSPDTGASCEGAPHHRRRRTQGHLGGCGNVTDQIPPVPPASRLPVMFVPPMLGSSFDVKLENPTGMPYYGAVCPTRANWTQIWIPPGVDNPNCDSKHDPTCLPQNLWPMYVDCWVYELSLVHNRNGTTSDPPGIQSRLHTGIDAVCATGLDCICSLLQRLGWNKALDFDGYPYDWRQGPFDWMQPGNYYEQLKAGFERLHTRTGKKVVAISFSLGGPVFAVFLNTFVTTAWKDEHIASWISYSGTFGGVQQSLAIQLGTASIFTPVPYMTSSTTLATYRSWASQTWMATALPKNYVLVNVTSLPTQYTGADLARLYHDAGAPELAAHVSVAEQYDPTIAPGVEAFVIYGTGVPTPRTYQFSASQWTGNPDFSTTVQVFCHDGDEVADADSVEGVPTRWQAQVAQHGKPVHLHNIGRGFADPAASHDNSPRTEAGLKLLVQSLLASVGNPGSKAPHIANASAE